MFPDTSTLPQTLVTLEYLTTLPGLVIMTYLLTYFFKYPIKALYKKVLKKNPPKIFVPFVAAVIAFGINMWVLVVLGTVSTLSVGLAVFNAFVAAFAAFISHDFIKDKNKLNSESTIVNNYNIPYEELRPVEETFTAIRAGDRDDEPPSTKA